MFSGRTTPEVLTLVMLPTLLIGGWFIHVSWVLSIAGEWSIWINGLHSMREIMSSKDYLPNC